MKVTILGCGGSDGVPMIGGPDNKGDWGACDPGNPKNRRFRSSILVEAGDDAILVDAGPDLKYQMLAYGLSQVTAVLFTHEHADHTHGVHELRRLAQLNVRPMEAWGSVATMAELQTRFSYVFNPFPGSPYGPILTARTFEGPFRIGDIDVLPFDQDHGFGAVTTGFRFGPVAYTTDATTLDDKAFSALQGVDTWIVDCQQYRPHPTHSHLEKSLDWIARVRPRRAFLTHMGPELDYETLCSKCPTNVEPAWDGLQLQWDNPSG